MLLLSIASCGGPAPTLRATVVPMAIIAPVLSSRLEPDGMVQVYVPAGELPRQRVYLDAFWVDRTEVTNAMFRRFVAATGYTTSAEKRGVGAVHVDWMVRPGGE